MDKVSDTPRKADFITLLNANAEIDMLRQSISVWYEIAANRLRDLAEQKEQLRVLEDEMLVLGDERNESVAALQVAVGLLSTMPKYSSEHPDYTLEYILNIAREMK